MESLVDTKAQQLVFDFLYEMHKQFKNANVLHKQLTYATPTIVFYVQKESTVYCIQREGYYYLKTYKFSIDIELLQNTMIDYLYKYARDKIKLSFLEDGSMIMTVDKKHVKESFDIYKFIKFHLDCNCKIHTIDTLDDLIALPNGYQLAKCVNEPQVKLLRYIFDDALNQYRLRFLLSRKSCTNPLCNYIKDILILLSDNKKHVIYEDKDRVLYIRRDKDTKKCCCRCQTKQSFIQDLIREV